MRAIVVAGLVACAAASPAVADCMSQCMARYGCGLDYEAGRVAGRCQTFESGCRVECERAGGAGAWGAIAYSRATGAAGWTHDQPDERAAAAQALKECGKHAKECEVLVTVENACAALAAGQGGFGWGRSAYKGDAQGRALAECVKAGGKGCAVEAWVCALR